MGRGPWAGPVVAAACCFKNLKSDLIKFDIFNDSKKLTKKQREKCYRHILDLKKNLLLEFYIGQASVQEIDKLNILKASLLAMKRAINGFDKKKFSNTLIIVDGINKPDITDFESLTLVKGDEKSISIASASIIAKIYRDDIMKKLSINFPEYKWEQNMGYGTADHINALKSIGISKHHRKTFKPISKLIHNNY